jgi:hypothetical protein
MRPGRRRNSSAGTLDLIGLLLCVNATARSEEIQTRHALIDKGEEVQYGGADVGYLLLALLLVAWSPIIPLLQEYINEHAEMTVRQVDDVDFAAVAPPNQVAEVLRPGEEGSSLVLT